MQNTTEFNLTVIGASHIKNDLPCQDCSFSFGNGELELVIVCDGHGGSDYFRSETGAKCAVETAKECLLNKKTLSRLKKASKSQAGKTEQYILSIEENIIAEWNKKVRAHFDANPIAEGEMKLVSQRASDYYLAGEHIESIYGTTLIAFLMLEDFWLGIQIGDGKCVVLDADGEWLQPIPWNDKCFLNATTSLCQRDAITDFRHSYGISLPKAVFIGSDGVDDCFANDKGLSDFYSVVYKSFNDMSIEAAVAELQDYLPRLSAKGSRDDISIGAIIRHG